MKAAQIKEYGSVENIEVVEVERPTPGVGQVLVEVQAASLNPVDTFMREGYTKTWANIELPVTLGGDIAGTVSAVGEGVTVFKTGDKVYGQAGALRGGSGAFAEYAVTGAEYLALAPSNISMDEAASLPLVGASALQALAEHMQLTSGQKLFVHGASGGIGTVAVQVAKDLGAYVAASAKGDRVEFVKGLGADEVIDSEKQDYATLLRDYDAVLVLARDNDWAKIFSVLKDGGTVVSLVGPAEDDAAAKARNIVFIPQMTHTDTPLLDALRGYVEKGVVTPQVAETFSLDQVREAFTKREAGGISGKVVIQIKA